MSEIIKCKSYRLIRANVMWFFSSYQFIRSKEVTLISWKGLHFTSHWRFFFNWKNYNNFENPITTFSNNSFYTIGLVFGNFNNSCKEEIDKWILLFQRLTREQKTICDIFMNKLMYDDIHPNIFFKISLSIITNLILSLLHLKQLQNSFLTFIT